MRVFSLREYLAGRRRRKRFHSPLQLQQPEIGYSPDREDNWSGGWSKATIVADGQLRVQARAPFQAAIVTLAPGVYGIALGRPEEMIAGDPRKVANDVLRVIDTGLDALFPARRARREQQARQALQAEQLQQLQARQLEQRSRPPAAPAANASVEAERQQLAALRAQLEQQLAALQAAGVPTSSAKAGGAFGVRLGCAGTCNCGGSR